MTSLAAHWKLAPDSTDAVPARLRLLIEAELSEIPAATLRMLEAASVAGPRFATALVAEALGMQTEAVEDLCESQARRAQVVRRTSSLCTIHGEICAEYEFLHPLHRQVLYEAIPPYRRARLQGQMANGLARIGRIGAAPEDVQPPLKRPGQRGEVPVRVPVPY